MNTLKKLFFPAIALIILFSLMSGCASVPPLKAGISPGYPPLAFMKDGLLTGIEPDLARQLEKQSGGGVVFEVMPFHQLIPALRSGKIDLVMAGLSVTPDRQAEISFTEPYMSIGQMMLVREKDIARFPKSLFNRQSAIRAGVERGSTGEQFALANSNPAGVVRFSNTDEGIRALESGQIDCFIHDAPTIWRYSADPSTQRQGLIGLFEPLTSEPLAWGVRKGDTVLLQRLNSELEAMRKSGVLQEILSRWIRTRVEVGFPGRR